MKRRTRAPLVVSPVVVSPVVVSAVVVSPVLVSAVLAAVLAGGTGPAHAKAAYHAAGPGRPGLPALAQRVACPGPQGQAERQSAARPEQPIPAGFAPVAVVRCLRVIAAGNGHPLHSAPLREIAVSGLARLLAALHAPSTRLPPGVACAAQDVYIPWFVLVGSTGQVIRPSIPVDGCDQPLAPVLESLDALHWLTTKTTP